LTQNIVETQTKSVNGKNKTYSINFVQGEQAIITCTYKGEKRDRKNLNRVPYINSHGKKAVQITGWLGIFLGIVIFIGLFIALDYLVSLNFEESTYYLIIFIGSYGGVDVCYIGNCLLCKVKYVEATRCKRCRKNYAYEEREKPDVKEVSTESSCIVTITRHWRCKKCGYIDSSESHENIKTYRGLKAIKRATRKVKCEKCGRSGFNFEFKYSDVKSGSFGMKGVETTTRYYKCNSCGNINIAEEESEYDTGFLDFL